MRNWGYVVEHWQDISVYLALHARPPPQLADWIKLLLIPTVTVVVAVYVTQERVAATNARLDKLETRVDANTSIIITDRVLTERWGKRLDQLEARHDQIMQFILSAKPGSGYTYLPGEHKK